eukprot:TRINITY_DN2888_c0_g1_i1.p1 TRINITY_DN2888_c0_g1~~TRINITY_DN2888_c0_g1_i1.p1  ORF type:complete len:878 (+),score=167.16 TRINITY_DN2888_c0_g1_i1:146-2779(+)
MDVAREETLLHLLQVGRDCVDTSIVRWALRLQPEEDVQAILASKRKLCGSSAKTGLVKRVDTTPAPKTAIGEHPHIVLLDGIISKTMEVFVVNGNVHVSYWRLEEAVDWGAAAFADLRAFFTLPRLLAGFSLFDHNFLRRTCALSMRNYAVFGAERRVKDSLLCWQGGKPAARIAEEETSPQTNLLENGTDTPSSDCAAAVTGSQKQTHTPCEGTFLSVIDVMRQLRWPGTFGPHVGDFLEWAWQTPGIELGIRLSDAAFASKDARLELRDLSEKAALLALAARLGARPNRTEHIAACRQGTSWREYGFGPIERFVRKYSGWFSIDGEYISLRPEKAERGEVVSSGGQSPEGIEDPTRPPLTMDSAVPSAAGKYGGVKQDDQGQLDSADEDEDEEDVHEIEGTVASIEALGSAQARKVAEVAPHEGAPILFRERRGMAYHEVCLQQAVSAPRAKSGHGEGRDAVDSGIDVAQKSQPHEIPPPQPPLELAERLGSDVAVFARERAFAEGDWERRLAVCALIEAALKAAAPLCDEYPSLRVDIFGTSGSGLGQRLVSDLDLFLDLDGSGNRDVGRVSIATALEAARDAVEARGGEDLEVVVQARVPLVRGSFGGFRFDLSVGPLCGLWNTSLLRRFAAREPDVVIPLCVVAAAWSKAAGINDSPGGLLSTYSVLLLVVSFLQTVGVLPAALLSQDLEEAARVGCCADVGIEAVETPQSRRVTPPTLSNTLGNDPNEDVGKRNARLGNLLWLFFDFLVRFRWEAMVVSVRNGAPLLRSQKKRPWQVQPLCVEDPFETHLNTCRRVNPRGYRLVFNAAASALRKLSSGGGLASLLGTDGSDTGGAGKRGSAGTTVPIPPPVCSTSAASASLGGYHAVAPSS